MHTSSRSRHRLRRLAPFALAALALLLWVSRPVAFLARVAWEDARLVREVPAGFADDASGLERTAVRETWPVPAEREAALEGLRALLERARELTRELVDLALDLDGRYYLPYRLHATQAQFEAAYPMAAAFFAAKHSYDPDGRFTNRFYTTYGL